MGNNRHNPCCWKAKGHFLTSLSIALQCEALASRGKIHSLPENPVLHSFSSLVLNLSFYFVIKLIEHTQAKLPMTLILVFSYCRNRHKMQVKYEQNYNHYY